MYQISRNIVDHIEDLISKYSKSPASLQNELRALKNNGVRVEDVKIAFDENAPFGDPKLSEIILNNINGKPLDAAYIQAIDFNERDFSESLIGKLEEQCHEKDKAFLDTVVKPTFVTDWPVHKHEMVANFELPVYDAEHILENGDLRVLCSPTTVSMLEYISQSVPSIPANMVNEPERAEVLVSLAQDLDSTKTILETVQGPTLDEYLEGLGITTLDPKIVNNLTECDGLGLCKVKASLHDDEDFSTKIYNTRRHSLDQIVEWLTGRAKKASEENSKESNPGDKSETVVTPADISKALIYTGTAAGKEQFLEPDHLPLWDQMKADGLDKVVPIGGESLSKLLFEEKPIPSPADEILIIMSKPTKEDKIKEFGNYKLKAKPGDFFEVYEFCKGFSEKKDVAQKGKEGDYLATNDNGDKTKNLFRVVNNQFYRNSNPNGDIPLGSAKTPAPTTQGERRAR